MAVRLALAVLLPAFGVLPLQPEPGYEGVQVASPLPDPLLARLPALLAEAVLGVLEPDQLGQGVDASRLQGLGRRLHAGLRQLFQQPYVHVQIRGLHGQKGGLLLHDYNCWAAI